MDPNLGEIFIFKPYFEKEAKISQNQVEKVGKPLAAIGHFENIEIKDMPEKIRNIVEKIFKVE